MDFEGRPFRPQGIATWKDGWLWINRGDRTSRYVTVHCLEAARALCQQLNRGLQSKIRGTACEASDFRV
jgi:hypothetical protein